jgi:WD40 repeat protein
VYVVSAERETPAVWGQPLLPGQGVRTVGEDSSATVRFPDATRLELGRNTSLRVEHREDARAVFLAEGWLTADMPDSAEPPMVVSTPQAEVTRSRAATSGTRFSLSHAPGSLHIEPESGAVAVTRKRDGRSIRLKTGEHLLISDHGEPSDPRLRPPRVSAPAKVLGRHADLVTSLAFSPEGKSLVSSSLDGAVTFRDVASGRHRDFLSAGRRVSSIFFAPDGRTLAAVTAKPGGILDAAVELRDVETGRQHAAFPAVAHVHELRTAVFSPDGRRLASVDAERNIHVWDVATQEKQDTFRTRKGRLLCLVFSLDSQELTAADEYAHLTTWRLSGGRPRAVVQLEYAQGNRVCAGFSPDRRRFVWGTQSGTVQVWEADSGKLLATLHGHRGAVYCLAFSPDGALLATGSRDGTTRLWDVAGAWELATLEGDRVQVRSAAFSPDGKTLAVGGSDGTVKLWDVDALRGGKGAALPAGPRSLAAVGVGPDRAPSEGG